LEEEHGAASDTAVALVYCRGAITLSKLQIWRTRTQELRLGLELTEDPGDARARLVVLDKDVPLAKMLQWAKWPGVPAAVVAVTSDWILQSLRAGRRLDPLLFPLPAAAAVLRADTAAARPDEAALPPSEPVGKASSSSSSSSSKPTEPWAMRPENKAKLACQFTGTVAASNLNAHLTDRLEDIAEQYTNTKSKLNKNEFKLKIYNKAVGVLKQLDYRVVTAAQLDCIVDAKGRSRLGKSVTATCAEILSQGVSSKLRNISTVPGNVARVHLNKIWGVGPVTAGKMIQAGIRDIADARASLAADSFPLSFQQKIGIKHYEDFQVKIPRDEVARIEAYVREHVLALVDGAQVLAVGSYRRGKATSGDADILIAPPQGREDFEVMDKLLARMHETGFLTDDLAGFEPVSSPQTKRSYMGVCRELGREDAVYRRIDLKVYPRSLFAFALLYFTGSDYFNRSMRWYCHNFHYNGKTQHTLSDEGLMPCTRDNKGKVTHKGVSYVCNTERDIFEILGLDYKEPHERGVYNAAVTDMREADQISFGAEDSAAESYRTDGSDDDLKMEPI